MTRLRNYKNFVYAQKLLLGMTQEICSRATWWSSDCYFDFFSIISSLSQFPALYKTRVQDNKISLQYYILIHNGSYLQLFVDFTNSFYCTKGEMLKSKENMATVERREKCRIRKHKIVGHISRMTTGTHCHKKGHYTPYSLAACNEKNSSWQAILTIQKKELKIITVIAWAKLTYSSFSQHHYKHHIEKWEYL